jgi:Mrp family chromosome partitioning ATPase
MSGPQFSVEGVLDALAMQPRRRDGAGRAIMFVAARGLEGTTTAARAVANAAGPGAVYAIDLDIRRNALARALNEDGALGPRIEGELGGARFYTVRDLPEPPPAFFYHRVGRSRVYAGVFDTRALPKGARVGISARPDYWDAARAGGAFVVVDAPALDHSSVALRVAPHMDGVVLVVGSGRGAAPAALEAKELLIEAGANLMGLVYADADAPAVAIDRLLRQAG